MIVKKNVITKECGERKTKVYITHSKSVADLLMSWDLNRGVSNNTQLIESYLAHEAALLTNTPDVHDTSKKAYNRPKLLALDGCVRKLNIAEQYRLYFEIIKEEEISESGEKTGNDSVTFHMIWGNNHDLLHTTRKKHGPDPVLEFFLNNISTLERYDKDYHQLNYIKQNDIGDSFIRRKLKLRDDLSGVDFNLEYKKDDLGRDIYTSRSISGLKAETVDLCKELIKKVVSETENKGYILEIQIPRYIYSEEIIGLYNRACSELSITRDTDFITYRSE
jgi:hypothetical protein